MEYRLKTVITLENNAAYTVFKKKNSIKNQPAIVTVADLGCDEKDYKIFLSLPAMKTLLTRCQWIVIILPGQVDETIESEDCQAGLLKSNNSKSFGLPKFVDMAKDIRNILNSLELTCVVLFGEGLGANMLARVACLEDTNIMGAVLIHCCGVFMGPLAGVKDKMQQWRFQNLPVEPYTEKQFIDHRFGSVNNDNLSLNLKEAVSEFRQRLQTRLNLTNIRLLSVAYEQRLSLTEQIGHLSCPVLFLAGKQSSCLSRHRTLVEAVKKIHGQNIQNKVSIESIEYDDTVSPLVEKPEKVAESLRYFIQGLGLVSCLPCGTTTGAYKVNEITPMRAIPADTSSSPKTGDNAHLYRTSPETCRKRQGPPPIVRRQMSMAELDLPRGPGALSSMKLPSP